MSEQESRQCPLCHREHLLTDGKVPTWIVTYTGDTAVSQRTSHFIHREDAEAEVAWITRLLKEEAAWERNKKKLTIEEGEPVTWDDLFGEETIGFWEA